MLLVRPGNDSSDRALIFITKIVEGVSASFSTLESCRTVLYMRILIPLVPQTQSFLFPLFSFASANVPLVLGELMGQGEEDGIPSRHAIPLITGAIVTPQATMAIVTWMGNLWTRRGCGRKPLFTAG